MFTRCISKKEEDKLGEKLSVETFENIVIEFVYKTEAVIVKNKKHFGEK